MTYAELNSKRKDGYLAYMSDTGTVVVSPPTNASKYRIPAGVHKLLKPYARYIEPTPESLILFCDKVTEISRSLGVYAEGPSVKLDGRWFTLKEELLDYLASFDELSPMDIPKALKLLKETPIDFSKFERETGCSLITNDRTGDYTLCGITYSTLDSLSASLETKNPQALDTLIKKASISRRLPGDEGVVLDGVAFIALSTKGYESFKEPVALKGILSSEGTVLWKWHDPSRFYTWATDHGQLFVLDTLEKKKLKSVIVRVIPTDFGAVTMPYPIAVSPKGEYIFTYVGRMNSVLHG